ncbi:MAG: PIN domain-containing protein [Anaerolineae bacterium]|uniref:type II toxin-antitoxin system VapC family toxin n=1 Tax=Candidatus Amarolinea dominans TaxID=3140696 RepID=UPI00313724E7|nr:PIN domain-containing protein [Anaerolineae bacterium]
MLFVLDTHVLIWYFTGNQRLSDTLRDKIDQVRQQGGRLLVPTIVLAEALNIATKGRLVFDFPRLYQLVRDEPEFEIVEFGGVEGPRARPAPGLAEARKAPGRRAAAGDPLDGSMTAHFGQNRPQDTLLTVGDRLARPNGLGTRCALWGRGGGGGGADDPLRPRRMIRNTPRNV